MYIGDTDDGSGLHQMIYEVVDNSIDEALTGHCNNVQVILNEDGTDTVEDMEEGYLLIFINQRGCQCTTNYDRTSCWRKFDQNSYKVPGGLHGVGVSVVNALSEYLDLEINRDGKVYLINGKW